MNYLFSICAILLNIFSWIWYIHSQFHSNHKTSPSLWLASFISIAGDFFSTWFFSGFIQSASFGISFLFCGLLLFIYLIGDKKIYWRFDFLTSLTIIVSIFSLFLYQFNPLITLVVSAFFSLLSMISFLKDIIQEKIIEPYGPWFLSFLINLFLWVGLFNNDKISWTLPIINTIGCFLIFFITFIKKNITHHKNS